MPLQVWFPHTCGNQLQDRGHPDKTIGTTKGTVWIRLAGNIMETGITNLLDGSWHKTTATNSWKDKTQTTGGIRNLRKMFGYLSGLWI